jgi:hypothetical protein
MPIKRNPAQADPYVYEFGEVFAVSPISASEAEIVCREIEREHPTWDVDFSFSAGRAVIKFVDRDADRRKFERMKAHHEPDTGTVKVRFLPGNGTEVFVDVKYIAQFPRGADGTCAFCHGDPCNEESDSDSEIAKYFAETKNAETCPMCEGRAT